MNFENTHSESESTRATVEYRLELNFGKVEKFDSH